MAVSLPSRGIKGYAGTVLASSVSAATFTYALTHVGSLFVTLAYMSAIPLFMIGLGAGAAYGVAAAIIAVSGLFIVQPFNFTMYYVVLYALPVSLLLCLAMFNKTDAQGKPVWYSEGYLLTAIVVYPCLVFIAALAATAAYDGGLLAMTHDALLRESAEIKNADPKKLAAFQSVLATFAHILPMLIGCGWTLIMLLSLYVAQTTLSQQGWSLRPSFSIRNVTLPKGLVFAAFAALLIGVLAPSLYSYAGLNLSVVLFLPFLFGGIAVVHAWADTSLFRLYILTGYYLVLLVPFVFTCVPMILFTLALGVSDQWIDFRRRFAGKKPGRQI